MNRNVKQRIAHDTCLLAETRTHTRKGVGYLDRTARRVQSKRSIHFSTDELCIGWTEEEVEAWDVFGSDVHTYLASKEERDRYNQIYTFMRNTDGRTRECTKLKPS